MTSRSDLPSVGERWLSTVLLIFALAAATRAAFLWQVHNDPVYVSLGQDEAVNDQVAHAILAGEMPAASFYKAPLYMYSLAGLYRLFGEEPGRVRWVHVFVDSLSPVLLALIGRRLFGWLAGLIAGILGALFWSFVFYSAELVDTSLACMLYLLLAYLMAALPEGRWYKWLVCGVVLGLGAITRPNILAFAPVLALAVVFATLRRSRQPEHVASASERLSAPASDTSPTPDTRNPIRDTRLFLWSALPGALINIVALAVGCCVTIAPVTLHNRIVGGEWVPIATYGGLNFYAANSPWSDGKNGPLLVTDGRVKLSYFDPNNLWSRLDLNYNIARGFAQRTMGRPLKMGEVDKFFNRHTLEYIRTYPGKFLTDTFKRFCWFFNRYEFANVKDPYRLCGVSPLLGGLSWFHYGFLCPIAVLGLIFAMAIRGKSSGTIYHLVLLASLFLPGLFFVMNSRYRLPTVYLIVPFAAYGAIRFVDLWRRPAGWAARVGACAVLAGVGVLSNLNLFGYATSEHTELLMTYAQGCLRTNRDDLLAEAAPRFEQAYWAEVKAGGRPWAASLDHCKPLAWLFEFYCRLGNRAKTMEYGRQMVRQETFSPPMLRFYDWLLEEGQRKEALRVMNILEARLLSTDPARTVKAFMKYWERFHDPEVLARLEVILAALCREHPGEESLRKLLAYARQSLEVARTTSQPAAISSRQTGAPTSKEAARR